MKICWTKEDILWLVPNQEGIRLEDGEWIRVIDSATLTIKVEWIGLQRILHIYEHGRKIFDVVD